MKRTWSQANANQYGELGIIESVRLRNFMCHDNLSFEFDPHMNFIVGRNGSGKSAILTGIILALGGKSGATGRYSNIKGFVKTGKNSATVSVTLINCGPDAYKPDDYGEKITVERHFTSDGVSSYKLKSEKGHIVSNSKEELSNILYAMNIQIENPVTVLTQEISRNFLVSKNSKGDKLFNLFYQGTGLSEAHERYNKSLTDKEDAKLELENKKAVLPDVDKDIKSLKSFLDKSSKITDLKKELCWSIVIELEKKRDEEAETFEKLNKDVSNLNRKINFCETKLADIAQSLPVVHADAETSKQKMQAIRKNLDNFKSKKISLQSEIREVQGECSRHEREVKKIESEIISVENVINEIKMKNQDDINEDKLRHEIAIKNLKNQITNTEAAIGMRETRKTFLWETLTNKQKEMDGVHTEIQEINYEKDKICKDKKQLTDGMKNRLNVFGQEIINVLRDIQAGTQRGMFKKEPKGPIGLYINVKQSEWNFAVQECLKMSLLKTFLCDNYEDEENLTKLFNKHFQRFKPSIITQKFASKVYDVTHHKCQCQYPTLFDMLNIDDPVIANCLIDQKQIENILLIADPVEAGRVMLYSPPGKCKFAYSLNGDQFCHSPFRKYSCRNRNKICILKTVNEDDIRKKDEEIKLLNVNLAKKTNIKENLSEQLKLNEQEVKKSNDEIRELKIKINQLHMKLKDEENTFSEPRDISGLQADLDEIKRDKVCHEEKFNSSRETVTSKVDELNDLEKNIEECRRILQMELLNCQSLSGKEVDYLNEKEKLNSAAKKMKSQIRESTPLLEKKQNALAECKGAVDKTTLDALKSCPRIDTRRSSDTIRQLLNDTEKFIQNQKNCDRESILNEYEEKVKKFNKSKSDLMKQEKVVMRLGRMITERFKEFQQVCKNTHISLTCSFTTLLKENNFIGHPEVNYDKHTLEIFANPEKTNSKLPNKCNLMQLSGGERSYVTIAFLLALWDRIHMPFRILDEYDVFMDSNNRHLSIHLLINTAKSNKKVQYIFLSPLELPHIEDSAHVKIHKMPAPRK